MSETIEELLRGALALCPVEGAAPITVEESLAHGEYGLAFEVFIDLLVERNQPIRPAVHHRLQKAGAAMGFTVETNTRYRTLTEKLKP